MIELNDDELVFEFPEVWTSQGLLDTSDIIMRQEDLK